MVEYASQAIARERRVGARMEKERRKAMAGRKAQSCS
jgi:hypothetical protein